MMRISRKSRRKALPLDYIIVAAHSDDSELIKTLFSNGVDVKQNQYLFSRALREGLKILTCYPFAKGRSCDDTKVLLLKSSAEKIKEPAASSRWRCICRSMHVLAHLLSLFRPVACSGPAWLPLLFCCLLVVRVWRRRLKMRTKAVSERVMTQLAPSARRFDYHSVALVNWQTLVYLGLPCYSWVRWKVHSYKNDVEEDLITNSSSNSNHCSANRGCDSSSGSAHRSNSSGCGLRLSSGHRCGSGRDLPHSDRVCLQMLRCDQVSGNDIVISTTMWHALAGGGGSPYRRNQQLLSEGLVWQPPIASAVQVAQLYTAPELQLSLDQCETLLKSYFDRDRLVRAGDVLCVPLECDPAWPITRERVAHFRVQSVCGMEVTDDVAAGYLYRHQVTSLAQVSDVTVATPSLQPLTSNEWENGAIPTGMELEVSQLVSAMRSVSAAHPSSTLSYTPLCPTLIAVCCRDSEFDWLAQSVLSAAAAESGCVISYMWCHQLIGESGTSGATCAKLRQQLGRFTSPTPPSPSSPTANSQPGCLKHVLVLRQAYLLACDSTGDASVTPSIGSSRNVDWRQLSVLLQLIGELCTAGVCVVLTVDSVDQLIPQLAQRLTHVLHIPLTAKGGAGGGGECQQLTLLMKKLIVWLAQCDGLNTEAVENSHGLQTLLRGVQISDLPLLVQRAKLSCLQRIEQWFERLDRPVPVNLTTLSLDLRDFTCAAEMIQSRVADRVGVPRVVNTKWCDIGGLSHVRELVMDTIDLQLSRPELLASGIKRSGILLYGPPGTGKTMVARAVATECNLNFLSVKGPELMNMYIGESEANVRDVFDRARQAAPCVIFFDELDSLAPNRGNSSDSGGVMDRITAQLLTELDSAGGGTAAAAAVFVIGATNRPDLLDPSLLRPGRLDKLVYLAPADNKPQQLEILRAQTRRMQLSADVDLENVVTCLPDSVTGADIFALCEKATGMALDRAVDEIETDGADEETVSLQVNQDQLIQAASSLVPSVSAQELQRYEQLRRSIEGR